MGPQYRQDRNWVRTGISQVLMVRKTLAPGVNQTSSPRVANNHKDWAFLNQQNKKYEGLIFNDISQSPDCMSSHYWFGE